MWAKKIDKIEERGRSGVKKKDGGKKITKIKKTNQSSLSYSCNAISFGRVHKSPKGKVCNKKFDYSMTQTLNHGIADAT